MLFNNHHNIPPAINRTNYEEYFLLYVDNELPAAECTAVEDFVTANPDLKAELDVLLSTRVAPEVAFIDSHELLASAMADNETEEQLLLYIDDELSVAGKAAIEQQLKENEKYSSLYTILQKTKSGRNEVIPFPGKKALYHSADSTIAGNTWLRVAVVLLIVFGAGLWLLLTPHSNQNNIAATHKKPIVMQPAYTPPPAPATPVTGKQNGDIAVVKQNTKKGNLIIKKDTPALTTINSPILKQALHKAAEEQDRAYVKELASARIKEMATPLAVPSKMNEINANPVVTSAPAQTYNSTEGSETATAITDAVADNSGKHKINLKGFLRKATRFIEHTTHVDPVNEDGTLLIGAVSFKVK